MTQPQPPTGRLPRPTQSIQTPKRDKKSIDTRNRFAAARERARANMGAWAGEETVHRWIENRTPLYLHTLAKTGSKFGPRWVLHLSEESPDEKPCNFGQPSNVWRDALYADLEERLKEDESPIGPLMIVEVETASGQIAYDLTEWSDE
ncbi:MAG: hypothetical protein ACYCSN_13580 [Acidobacteriaceae bacterium]